MFDLKLHQIKGGFFDRKAVVDATDRGTRRVLSRFGAFVRQRARTSIRKRKDKISPPGSPPYSHVGLLRKFIFFAYEDRSRSVVVGPVRLNGTESRGTAPRLLEYGGRVRGDGRTISVARGVGRDVKGRFVSQGRDTITLSGMLTYRPRPFMRPALDAELPKLPRMWKGSIR